MYQYTEPSDKCNRDNKIMSLVNVDMVEAVLQALLSKRYSNNFGVCHVQGYHIVP